MSALRTEISWTQKSWNPLRGCSRVSEGCVNCYAEAQAGRFSGPGQPYEGLVRKTSQGFKWTGKVNFIEKDLEAPLRWRTPSKVFVNSMSDLFHEKVSMVTQDRIFDVMQRAYWHTFQILTKRPEIMSGYSSVRYAFLRDRLRHGAPLNLGNAGPWPLPHVWLGVSIENRATLQRLKILRGTHAAVRFLSLEPLLEDLGTLDLTGIHWVIVGGESGAKHRPCDVAWIDQIVEQCREAKVACWVKQDAALRSGQQGRLSDEVWQVKQFPTPQPQQLTLMEG